MGIVVGGLVVLGDGGGCSFCMFLLQVFLWIYEIQWVSVMAIARKMKIASIGTSLPFLPMDSWMFEWTFWREGFHVSLVFLQQYVLWRCKSKPSETLGTSTAKLRKGSVGENHVSLDSWVEDFRWTHDFRLVRTVAAITTYHLMSPAPQAVHAFRGWNK